MELSIIDKTTGELIDLKTIESKLSKQISALSKAETAAWFVNYRKGRHILDTIEQLLKFKILNDTKVDFEEGDVDYDGLRVKRVFMQRFDKKKLLNSGNDIDIADYKRLEKKYTTASSYPKII